MDTLFSYSAVDHRRVQLLMPQELFYLLDRHHPVEQVRGDRPPKPVGMGVIHLGLPSQLPEHVLDTSDRETVMGLIQCLEQRLPGQVLLLAPGLQVAPEIELGPICQIGLPLF